MKELRHIPELLAPAGNLEKLRTALLYGANAVYLGGREFNLRAAASGFGGEELGEARRLADRAGARLYYCVNSFPREGDLARLPGVLEEAAGYGVDAFIAADPGVCGLIRKYAPGVEIHLSTQANTVNSAAVSFWADQGVKRVNLARELRAGEIRSLAKYCARELPGMELEVFAHGAMCLAVSGQCLLSVWLNGRGANEGRCTQPCRFEYREFVTVEERLRAGERLWEVGAEEGRADDEGYAALWAPDELCLLPYLRWFAKVGISALKLEGRMKGRGYLAHVTDAYSTALKACATPGEPSAGLWNIFMPELLAVALRPLSTGFFLGGRRWNLTRAGEARGFACKRKPEEVLLAELAQSEGDGVWRVDVLGPWDGDMAVELMLPGLQRPLLRPGEYSLENALGERVGRVHPGVGARLCLDKRLDCAMMQGAFIRAALGGAMRE